MLKKDVYCPLLSSVGILFQAFWEQSSPPAEAPKSQWCQSRKSDLVSGASQSTIGIQMKVCLLTLAAVASSAQSKWKKYRLDLSLLSMLCWDSIAQFSMGWAAWNLLSLQGRWAPQYPVNPGSAGVQIHVVSDSYPTLHVLLCRRLNLLWMSIPEFITRFKTVVVSPWWAVQHHHTSLSLSLLKRRGRKYNGKGLKGWDKDRKITQQLPSQLKQT